MDATMRGSSAAALLGMGTAGSGDQGRADSCLASRILFNSMTVLDIRSNWHLDLPLSQLPT